VQNIIKYYKLVINIRDVIRVVISLCVLEAAIWIK